MTIAFDPKSREITHFKFTKLFDTNKEAKKVFRNLLVSGKLEIERYLANLKTEESVDRNILRAINFLLGKERFAGRDKK